MQPPKQQEGGVQSVARIFTLIEVLASHPGGAGLQRIAGEANLAKSTAHRLLGSLVALGYAAQDPRHRVLPADAEDV